MPYESGHAPHALRAAHLEGLALAALGAVFFSAKAVVGKLMYRHGIDAISVLALRMLLSAPLFALVAAWSWGRAPRLSAQDLLRIAGLGFLGYYLSSTLDFIGLQFISAGLERLILFLTPSLVLLIGLFAFKRRVSRRQWLSLTVAYAGIVLVFLHDVAFAGSTVMLGAALVFGSALAYAMYLLLAEDLLPRVGALRLTALAMLVSSFACLAQYAILRPLPSLFEQTAPVWGLALVIATLCTVLPVFMTMFGVARIGAGEAAQAGMIGPVSTLFLAWWLLAEPLTPLQLAGTALVLVGIFLLSRKRPAIEPVA